MNDAIKNLYTLKESVTDLATELKEYYENYFTDPKTVDDIATAFTDLESVYNDIQRAIVYEIEKEYRKPNIWDKEEK